MKLNLGSGDCKLEGYVNIDIRQESNPDMVMDIRFLDERIANNSIAEIHASHVLEHLPHWQYRITLMNWIDKLQPGGILRILVPDLLVIVENITQAKTIRDWRNVAESDLFGKQDHPYNYHCNGFSPYFLRDEIIAMGMKFVSIHRDKGLRQFELIMEKELNAEIQMPEMPQSY